MVVIFPASAHVRHPFPLRGNYSLAVDLTGKTWECGRYRWSVGIDGDGNLTSDALNKVK